MRRVIGNATRKHSLNPVWPLRACPPRRGWDAHLPGEPCGGTECVSQYAKAVYAVRGLMVLARKGVAQTHW